MQNINQPWRDYGMKSHNILSRLSNSSVGKILDDVDRNIRYHQKNDHLDISN